MADPVFLITGASAGIGSAVAREASAHGYRVVLAARRAGPIEDLAAELGGPERALAVPCDVTEWSSRALVERALGRLRAARRRARERRLRRAARVREEHTPSTGARWCSRTSTAAALTVRATLPT